MATKKKATKRTTKKRRTQTVEAQGTVADLVAAFLVHLEHEGRGQGTIFSYGIELRAAAAEFGPDTLLVDLTAEKVMACYDCERVTQTRSGKPKSPAGVAKTRRVLRQTIAWGSDRGLVPADLTIVDRHSRTQ